MKMLRVYEILAQERTDEISIHAMRLSKAWADEHDTIITVTDKANGMVLRLEVSRD